MQRRPDRRALLVVAGLLGVLLLQAGAQAATPWYVASFDRGETDVFDGWGWDHMRSGHVGPGLRATLREDSHYGATSQIEMAALGLHEVEELYWRYWLRLDEDFWVEAPYRGKLPGPAGLYSSHCRGNRVSTEARPCWSARTMFSRDRYDDWDHPDYVERPNERTQLGSYVYHLDGPSNRGDLWSWDETTGVIDHGTWHCIEGRVRMNTPGAADGVLQNWVDGEEAFDRRDVRFRRSDEPQLHVKSFWNIAYYGGSGTSPRDNDVWFDSLVLSPRRVGCGSEAGTEFADQAASVHRHDIDWLAARAITRGCNPPDNTLYCPDTPVTRAQMAAFLGRTLGLPAADGDQFTDDDRSVHEADIQALAAAGITRGCNPPANTRFCPDDPVTRAEMAAFVVRAWKLPAAATTDFEDIADSDFRRDIAGLAAAGITRGCDPPDNERYCPEQAVTRAQMATFLRRAAIRPPR